MSSLGSGVNRKHHRYLAIIPARGGSKRVPRKNLKMLAGKPLITYTIEAALASSKLTRVVVSTDDAETTEVAKSHGADVPALRPAPLAQDTSGVIDAILHMLECVERDGVTFEAVVLLQPTSPFRTGSHIDECIGCFESSSADTVTSVRMAQEHPYYAWKIENKQLVPLFSMEKQMMVRQDLPPVFIETGAIYVIRRSVLAAGSIYGKKVVPYIMDADASVDIDTMEDMLWAEFLMQKRVRDE